MKCTGEADSNGTPRCCYVDGRPCRYAERGTVAGREWACGLRRRLGSWDKVHAHPGYRKHIQPVWDRVGIESCGTFTCDSCVEAVA